MLFMAALALAWHYPLGAPPAIAFVLGLTWFAARCTSVAWIALPVLLPVVGLAPWTGWLTFEEFDLALLAVAAGSYAGLATQVRQPACAIRRERRGPWVLLGLFAISCAVALYRGFADAGGFSFGWFQGYHEPMNSVRVAKPYVWAILLLPLWHQAWQRDARRTQWLWTSALTLALTLIALTTMWERAAFTNLLNFSADYRTTGLFWEMHVGGAALDGFLALTVPFALHGLLTARAPWHWNLSAASLTLAAYACLTTFSRGVYLAVPVGIVAFLGLRQLQMRNFGKTSNPMDNRWTGAVLVLGFGAGAAWIFAGSGYRGMAALFGTVVLMLPLAQLLRRLRVKQWIASGVAGLLLVLTVLSMAWLLPKGAYLAWTAMALLTATSLWLTRRHMENTNSTWLAATACGGFTAMLVGDYAVARHWGQAAGSLHALPVLLVVFGVALWAGLQRKPLWPETPRIQAFMVGTMAIVAMLIGVMGGGTYMNGRVANGSRDLAARIAHWQLGINMLTTQADWLLGKGYGRFPANYSLIGNPRQRPGDYRLASDSGNAYLLMTGGLQAGAEMLRVSQRVTAPGKQALLTAQVLAQSDVKLAFEVCEKHLLYSAGCMAQTTLVKSAPGVWQSVRLPLEGNVSRGDWYAPRWLTFSVGVSSTGGKVGLDDLALRDSNGRQLLSNGDFSNGLANWFTSSDRNHLPWHIKSLFMNVLFDQGLLGLTLWLVMFALALWRLSRGPGRDNPLAPALAAALIGFAMVGLFDSLLDVPRVAWMYYFLLLVALTLPRSLGQLARKSELAP